MAENDKITKSEKPEYLKRPWKPTEKSERYWRLPEVSRISDETGEAIKITLDVDDNRVNVLSETGKILEGVIEDLQATFSNKDIRGIKNPQKQKEAIKSLKDKISENSILDRTGNALQEFRNIPLIHDLLTPAIYARVEFVFNELHERVREIVLSLQKKETDYKKLSKELEALNEFQVNAAGDVSGTINGFANQLKTFGGSIIELKDLLNEALKIPGYPLETVRAVYTYKEEKLSELQYNYDYYRDSPYPPQELKEKKDNLQGEKNETLSRLRTERFDHVRNIVGHIEDMGAFTEVVKRLLGKDIEVDFDDYEFIEMAMRANIFEKSDIFGFLAEKGILDDKSVIESLGKLGKLQEKIEIWQGRSITEMFENKLRNENFVKLKTGDESFREMYKLYKMWSEVADKVKPK